MHTYTYIRKNIVTPIATLNTPKAIFVHGVWNNAEMAEAQ